MNSIPQSTALAEASPDSLSELFSRDPEGLTRQDRDRIVAALREQRVKWEASEAAGPKSKAKRVDDGPSGTTMKAGDLGL